ncbi:MAG: PEGA domain-containing protein, partial [Deltaproteobacteria bacterium]|nr:PEGA domain-containing protein [Deltaproteobacteria bacterium]
MMIAAGGSTALAKDKIAVLGLEVIDPNGTPTVQDAQIAKDLTEGLRGRAKAGTGPFQLAPGSDKELADLKLLNSCDEGAGCMASIGNQLGADVLMYGRIEKSKGAYQVTMKLLDVRNKKVEKSSSDVIPMSQATNAAELQGWAKKIYGKLTGETSTGLVAVKLHNADHGTILINGEEKGNITNGAGQVAGLNEGKYKLAVESEGFHRWEQDVTVTAGQTTTVGVDLEKSGGGGDVVVGTGSGEGSAGPGPGPGHGGGSSGTIWKVMAIGGIAGAAVSGGLWTYAYFSDISPYDGKAVTVNDAMGKPLATPPGSGQCGA